MPQVAPFAVIGQQPEDREGKPGRKYKSKADDEAVIGDLRQRQPPKDRIPVVLDVTHRFCSWSGENAALFGCWPPFTLCAFFSVMLLGVSNVTPIITLCMM